MATGSRIDHADVLAVFERGGDPSRPLTAPEVAEAVGCARRTAHKKLTSLADRGDLATKKVGSRGRVWWQPTSSRTTASTADADGSDGTVGDGESGVDAAGTRSRGDRTHERALRDLHDASRRLIRAESRAEVCEIAVEAARRVLGLSLSGLWLHDPDRGVLDPVAWTDEGAAEYGEPAAFPVDGSLAGQAFREGTYRVYDDITTEEEVYDPETRVRSELVLPLGEYGVLNASSPDVGVFDEVDVSLARVLAANVETAIERADRLEERRARRRELERRRDELETLNRINALVEETIAALVGAATRAEIERTVCERLAASELYVDAWIVERGSSSGSVVVRSRGTDGGDAGALADDGDEIPGPNPAATAIEAAAPQVVPRIDDDERVPDRLREVVLASGARACLAVPLAYADTVFGALVVHAPEPDSFSDRERTAFETLGRVVGFVINATNNRRLLLGNTAVELEVALYGDDAWFLATAERLGGTVAVEGLVPTDGDALIEYVTVEEVDDASPVAVDESPAVEETRVLAAEDDRWYLECTVRDARLRALAEYGADVRTARATADRGTVTARFPATASPREAMGVVQEAFPTAELVAKRVVDTSDRSVVTVRQAIADRLTDRQRTVLRAAFLAGYYDSPRGTTARELAASLGIAPSTLHQHLQAASRKVLATVFDDAA
ncbi:bacterio-opsin activator domain-containing protein [Salinigranum sp. GCM10025319]|uniref:bacterio-opsin activator domain-containing protein n=1 Tax=Salinigranum sp. GCM10025319 TaxID=3252687 RepID=UPI00360D0983